MSFSNIVLFLAIILVPGVLAAVVITRLNRNNWRRVQEMQGKDFKFDGAIRHALELNAYVVSKNETIAPDAGGFAKVELLLDVQLPGHPTSRLSTCWLVEVDSLDQVLPGKQVSVMVDPKRPRRLFPNVPWAKPWIFN